MRNPNTILACSIAGILAFVLFGCHQDNAEQKRRLPQIPKDEVLLSNDSPKRAYIREATVTTTRRPLTDLVTAKIVYDEKRTARVSSPIAGRVVGGKAASQMLEGERRTDITVRLVEEARNSVGAIENLLVPATNGSRIPLAELATIKVDQGASRISREGNMRRIAIKCNLIGRDQGSFVAEARQQVAERVSLPPGTGFSGAASSRISNGP